MGSRKTEQKQSVNRGEGKEILVTVLLSTEVVALGEEQPGRHALDERLPFAE